MLGEGLLLLVTGAGLALAVAACGRGHRIPGPSWFDIPHDTGRTAARADRRDARRWR